MSQFALTAPTGALPFYPARLAGAAALRSAWRGWKLGLERRRRARREQIGLRELHAMDDRQLADIGLSRCDLPRVAAGDSLGVLADDAAAWHLAFHARRVRFSSLNGH